MNHFDERRHVVDLCLTLSRKGYFAGTGGNLMLRIDAALVAVTPSATDYLTMRPQDVCVLRLDDLSRVEGELAPSVESSLHARVLKARPEVGCSIHTHQPVASACALLGRAMEVPSRHQAVLGPRVPLVGYAPSGSRWLASKLARALTPASNAYLMRNHGILCCGADSDAAMRALDALEQLARDALREHIAARDARSRVLDLIPSGHSDAADADAPSARAAST
ncbi:class II aldolase/adducin family protein [Roseateles sp.]|uniref:class II aldolase/adducin family protein n=1 Tax=Roseateles sp. TaxID=1971397 RepID=UPI0031D37959